MAALCLQDMLDMEDHYNMETDQAARLLCPDHVPSPMPCLPSTSMEPIVINEEVPRRPSQMYLYREGHQTKTCKVCIARHVESYCHIYQSHVDDIKFHILGNMVKELEMDLTRRFPKCLLLECLFDAVERESWECFHVLLRQESSSLWIQCYNEQGENILQRLLCTTRYPPEKVDIAFRAVLNRLECSMESSALRDFINRRWIPVTSGKSTPAVVSDHETPLHMATTQCLFDCVLELLRCGANPDLEDDNNKTPMMLAAKQSSIDIIRALIEYGAKVSINSEYEDSAMTMLTANWSKKVKHNSSLKYILKMMLSAAEYVHICEYKILLPYLDHYTMSALIQGFPISCQDVGSSSDNQTVSPPEAKHAALMLTAASENIGALEDLLRSSEALGMDINKSVIPDLCLCDDVDFDCCGCTPLQAACRSGRSDNVLTLLQHGANPDFSGDNGRFPIFHIIENKRAGAMKSAIHLLRFGCEVNKGCLIDLEDNDVSNWFFPLDFYLKFNQLFLVQMLLVAGASHYCPELHSTYPTNDTITMVTSPTTLDRDFVPLEFCSNDMRKAVMKQLETVPSLYHWARTAIRRAMSRDITNKISGLPLPQHIKDYLDLEELDAVYQEYQVVEPALLEEYHVPGSGDSGDDEDDDDDDDDGNDSDASDASD